MGWVWEAISVAGSVPPSRIHQALVTDSPPIGGTLWVQWVYERTTVQNQAVAETTKRGVRVDDDLWERAQKKARDRRESVADVIRRALLAYVEEGK